MGKNKKSSRKGNGHSHATSGGLEHEEDFELYAEDVWEGDALGGYAKARWSEGPKKRRSEWLRGSLMEAQYDDDDQTYLSRRA